MKTKIGTINTCKRCNHPWKNRQEEILVCPKCKTPYWNKEKKIKSY